MEKKFATLTAALLAALAAECADIERSDTEIWNEGVEYYRRGDYTNALETLRPLMLSRSHGARAAEVVAKIAHDAAHRPGAEKALENLEEAAAAAQIALRAAPDDKRANDNFTRATEGLAELRESQHVNAVAKDAEKKDPAGILRDAGIEARKIMAGCEANATNPPAAKVAMADALGARATRLADAWIPLKSFIAQAVTNQEDAATISGRIDGDRAKTLDAAVKIGDLDADAKYPLAEIEQELTDFCKMTAMPPMAIQEDLAAQSNAWAGAAAECGREWQGEALDWTRAFRAKFPAWAQQYQQAAAASTNMAPLTAEAVAEISALSTKVEQLQIECVKETLPPKQEEAMEAIRRIIELLPPQQGGGQGGGQSGDQNQNKDKTQNKDENKNDRQQNGQDRQQNGDNEEKDNEDQPSEAEESKEDRNMEAMLMKAQERSDEHEEKKKARARKAKLPPNEKDW